MPLGVRRGLTPDLILDTALELIDREGLDRFSMRRLATELRVEPMSLYHHLPSRRAVLDGLVDRFLGEVDLPDPALPGTERIHLLAAALRRTALAHPHVFPLVATRPLRGDAAVGAVDALLAALSEVTADPDLAVQAFWAVTAYVTGALLAETGAALGLTDEPSSGLAADAVDGLDPDRHPYAGALAGRMAQASFADEYVRGLDLLLTGIRGRADGAAGA